MKAFFRNIILPTTFTICVCTSVCSAADAPNASVEMGGIIWSIPRAYISETNTHNARQDYGTINLSMLLPDLRPGATHPEEFQSKLGWRQQMTVLIEHGRQLREPNDLVAQSLRWAKVSKDQYKRKTSNCLIYHANFNLGEELYVCTTPFGILQYECSSENDVPSPSCTISENIDSKTTVTYSFSYHFADKAVEIDNKLRTLLENFRQKAK